MRLTPPIEPTTAEGVILGIRTRKEMERQDVQRREMALSYCDACRDGEHTSPPGGSFLCRCGVLTCACFVAGKSPVDIEIEAQAASNVVQKVRDWNRYLARRRNRELHKNP